MDNDALTHNIRGWVHYDNLCSTLQKQVQNARKQRESFEEQVKLLLKQQGMSNAIIQISGGQLQIQEEKSTSSLTMKSLQESLLSFFKAHPELPDKTKELLDFIKNGRQVSVSNHLKKLRQPGTPNE